MLTIVLLLLITISAALALFTRAIDELALRFGGLILGVWGVRSILMPQGFSTVTAIDLALSWLILSLLLGLALRASSIFITTATTRCRVSASRAEGMNLQRFWDDRFSFAIGTTET